MAEMNRRDAVWLATGLLAGLGGSQIAAHGAEDQKPPEPVAPDKSGGLLISDKEDGTKDLQSFMFREQVKFETSVTAPYTQYLKITPVRTKHEGNTVSVPSAALRVFQVDAQEYEREGGLKWKCGTAEGKIQFKHTPRLVMVVRDRAGMVNCFSLDYDLRC